MLSVQDLINHLSKFPADSPVLQSKDAEGNDFSAVDECSTMFVDKSYTGGRTDEVWDSVDLEDSADPGDEEEIYANFKKVVVIWPV